MVIELTKQDIEVIVTSLRYSKRNIAEARETPNEVRKENLEKIDAVLSKLSQSQGEK